ncbi:uncharacterized protein LOC114744429 [Neltuma alba]|uniref:uncharacterized protein LOC114744429 n=1 Tax=Neltuma alba TaxID=207710 RepID=UPI0010A5A11D|nr:uncharacterized protein LOC114744429 [Prosopis alba]XP_028788443.1 uncharacterized protein LOC114744429 [Prosopis alba]
MNSVSAIAASTSSSSSSLLNITKIPSSSAVAPFAPPHVYPNLRRRRSKWMILRKNAENQSITVASPTTTTKIDDDDRAVSSASDVVRNFYERINDHDVDSVADLIAENCVYEDLVFPRPFVGRKEILEFFRKFTTSTSKDLQFVIDDLSTDDPSSVGVIWHLEWKGKPFPFSKGCSFYRLEVNNGKRQIRYGRDSVEPAVKPGDAALAAIRSVTWLFQQFPQLADML